MKKRCGKYGKKMVIAVCWIFMWQLAAALVGNRILLVGPLQTLQALGERALRGDFWLSVGHSLLRIGAGFTSGLAMGLLLAAGSSRYKLLEEVLAPVMALLKAIPVASFVVLFLIWWRSAVLATAVSFCIVLPNIYVNTLEGIRHVDPRLLEMAQVLEIPAWNRFFYIYRPALKPYLDSAIHISAGMSWKSGVAAEVIGIPVLSVGEQLYLSKIYLDTAGVLAWTAVTVLASVACEQAVLALWRLFQRLEPGCRAAGLSGGTSLKREPSPKREPSLKREPSPEREPSPKRELSSKREPSPGTGPSSETKPRVVLELDHVSKCYQGRTVLEDVSGRFERGRTYCFRTPSGSGKTTLFRLIAGLEEPQAPSSIRRLGSKITMVFQEDRLCEEYSALINVDMVTGDREKSRQHLRLLLEQEDLGKPCRELSGGMKRRVAIARAVAAGGDVILLDEPYGGLDGESRRRVERYLHAFGACSAVLLATHVEENAVKYVE